MKILIYHSSDLDGQSSASILNSAFHFDHLIGLDYGQEFDNSEIKDEDELMIVDFSLKPFEREVELFNRIKSLIIIDHHQEHIKFCQDNKLPIYSGTKYESACLLAWKFCKDKNVPYWLRLLSDYDTWNNLDMKFWENTIVPFQYGMRMNETRPSTEEGLEFWNKFIDENNFKDTFTDLDKKIYENGIAIYNYIKTEYAKALEQCSFEIELEGHSCLCINGDKGVTQFRDRIKDYDLVLSFKNVKNEYWTVGLYTNKDIDCSKIVKALDKNGGGHKQASGCKLDDINILLKKKIESAKPSTQDEYDKSLETTYNKDFIDTINEYDELAEQQIGKKPIIETSGNLFVKYIETNDAIYILGINSKSGRMQRSDVEDMNKWLDKLILKIKQGKKVYTSTNSNSEKLINNILKDNPSFKKEELSKEVFNEGTWTNIVIHAKSKYNIFIDGDGTLWKNEYPDFGEPIVKNIELVNKMKEKGWNPILFTAALGSKGHTEKELLEHLKLINCPILKVTNIKSPHATAFIDDRAVNVMYNHEWSPTIIEDIENLIANHKEIEAWQIDKMKLPKIKKDGSNFFQSAKKINIKSSLVDEIQKALDKDYSNDDVENFLKKLMKNDTLLKETISEYSGIDNKAVIYHPMEERKNQGGRTL
jgi:hypothetical protein